MDRYPFVSMMPKPLEVDVEDGRIRLRSEFEHKVLIEQIPGARKVGRGRDFWGLPVTYTSFRLLDTMFPGHLLSEAATEARESLYGLADACRSLRTGLPDETIEAVYEMLGTRWLRPYQVEGAVYLASVGGGMLLDEPGLGKTAQVAAALRLYPDTLPALVVAPKSLIYNWQRELAAFGLGSTILHGDAARRRKAFEGFDPSVTPVMITTYDVVKMHSRISGYGVIRLKRCTDCDARSADGVTPERCEVHPRELNTVPWSTVVADEAHRISSPKAMQTRALWGVSESARNRWALTATPMEQSMVAFWSLLRFIDPVEWSTSTKYRDRWALQHTNFFGVTEVLGLRPDRADEFADVTGWRWLRRTKDPNNLPPKVTEFRHGELSPKEAKAYRSMSKQLMCEVEGGVIVAENHMTKTTRLLQLASSSLQLDGEQVVPVLPSSKLDLMEDTVGDFEGEPLVVWFKHVGVLLLAEQRLSAMGRNCVTLYGDKTAEERQAAVEAFQNGDVDTILLTAAAGSEGITLTRARVAICVERDWSSIKNVQLEDRIHRIGSEVHDDVLIVNLVMRGTIEEALYDALQEKAESIQEVLRDYENRSV